MSQIIIMAAILIYLAAMLGVGFYCSKQNNSVDDFYLGGRKLGPFVTSGIRLGTAAVTTRGFNEADMDIVADAIAMLVEDVDANKAKAMELVKGLTDKYPLYE